MLDYRVCPLADVSDTVRDFDATHLVSIIDPDMDAPATPSHLIGRHLVLKMHDVDYHSPDLPGTPNLVHVVDLVAFARALPCDARVVFHCIAGRRRSTAAALICDFVLCADLGDLDPAPAALRRLQTAYPQADPNRALLKIADIHLRLAGCLSDLKITRMMTLTPID